MAWNPAMYLQFGTQRTQPAIDLVHRIPTANPQMVIDLGCGPGNSTAVLRDRWPAHVIGVDSSEEMIRQARQSFPGGEWKVADIASLAPPPFYDVVFANASLQWLDDHERLIPRLMNMVRRGGTLAVQIPAYHEMPVAVALEGVFQKHFGSTGFSLDQTMSHHSAPFYFDLLSSLGLPFDLWQTTYFHPMASSHDVYRMVESTGVKPYLEQLSTDADRQRFEREALLALSELFETRPQGGVILPFERIFFTVRNEP